MSFIFNSQFGLGLMRDHLQSHAFARAALAPLGLTADELWEGLMNANTLMATPPLTVCHGDCHVQNSYVYDDDREWPHAADFPETGAVGLYDWQLTCMACWARDVSYIVATALPTATRSTTRMASCATTSRLCRRASTCITRRRALRGDRQYALRRGRRPARSTRRDRRRHHPSRRRSNSTPSAWRGASSSAGCSARRTTTAKSCGRQTSRASSPPALLNTFGLLLGRDLGRRPDPHRPPRPLAQRASVGSRVDG